MALKRIKNLEDVTSPFIRRLLSRSEEGRRPLVNIGTLAPRRGVSAVGGPTVTTAGSAYIQNLIDRKLLLDVAGQNISFTAGFIGTDIARDAIASAPAATSESLALFIRAMANSASRKQGLARIHEGIAREAQSAVITAFEGKFGGGANSYRAGQNRLSGKMSPTLRRSDLILATRDGIQYMNRAALDQGAAHWYRLNFGAMPAGRQRLAAPFPVKFDGQVVGTLTLRNNRASRGFDLPRGIWLSGSRPVPHDPARRGKDQFYTVKWFYAGPLASAARGVGRDAFTGGLTDLRKSERQRTKRDPGRTPFKDAVNTRGIRGAHFFDAGVEVIADRLPIAYGGLLLTWQKESSVSGTGPVARVIAQPE